MHSRALPSILLTLNWFCSSRTPEIDSLRKRFHDLTEVSLSTQKSLRLMRHASTWVQSKYITLSWKISEQEKDLSNSLLEPGCLSRRIPINVVDHILSYVSQSDLGWWSPSEQIILRPKTYRSVYDLDISWRHSREKIRNALEIPRFDVNILADTTSPELLIDDGDPDNDEVHVWSRIEDFEEYIEKLAAASDLTPRIKSFNLQLVMAYNTYSLFLSAAARSFWLRNKISTKIPGQKHALRMTVKRVQ